MAERTGQSGHWRAHLKDVLAEGTQRRVAQEKNKVSLFAISGGVPVVGFFFFALHHEEVARNG